jgi:hypothetical protein
MNSANDRSHVWRNWLTMFAVWAILSPLAVYLGLTHYPGALPHAIAGVLAGAYWLFIRPALLLVVIYVTSRRRTQQ